MSAAPTHAPTVGERDGDWVAQLIAADFVVWNYDPETEDAEHNSSSYGAGDTVESDVDYAWLWTALDTEHVNLPAPATYGTGKPLRLYAASACRLRAAAPTSGGRGVINGAECTEVNELYAPAKTTLECVANDDAGWTVSGYNGEGTPVPLAIVTQGSEDVVDGEGNQIVTASSTGATINAKAKFVTVNSTSADYIVQLPTPRVGKEVQGYVGDNGCELTASTTATGGDVSINGVAATTGYELAIPADTLWKATCVGATDWSVQFPNQRPTRFSGALVKLSANHTIVTSTWTTLDWGAEEYDTDGYHDNSTNNTRLTIPAGVSKVRLAFDFLGPSGSGRVITVFNKNGSSAFLGQCQATFSATTGSVNPCTVSPVISVSEGDYFEALYYTGLSGTIYSTYASFGIEAVEHELKPN